MRASLTQRKIASPAVGEKGLRLIAPVSLAAGPTSPAIVPARLAGQQAPRVEWVAPGALFVEEEYQRQLSRNSLTLIRKIVAGWNWAHVKPPICARAGGGRLCVIDGQHTAIAAVTHGGIEKLPVIIVEPGAADRRAAAFIAHNRDRLHLTPMQMHYAALAAGDQAACAVNSACLRAGAHICRVQPSSWKPGDTVAIAAIAALVKAAGVEGAAEVLTILVDARRAPVAAAEIKAVAALLHDRARACEAKALAAVVRSETREVWARLADSIAAEREIQSWRALADLWRSQLNGAPRIAPAAAVPTQALGSLADAVERPVNGGGIAKPAARAAVAAPTAPPARLPRVEAEILAALVSGPTGFHALIRRTAYPGNAISAALTALLHAGEIARTGELYRRLQ